MTKQESMVLKGVAILFMLFLHLFNQMSNVCICENLMTIGDLPLAYILTRATSPVPFFIILSGYGLYLSHHKGSYSVWKKLKGLYVHYWIALLIFVTLGAYIASNRYPGNIVAIINNVTAWDTSYNGEIWFLFPYAMVMLTSKWIVNVLDRFNPWQCLGGTFFLSLCTGFAISRYGAQYLYHNQLAYKPILYLSFLFPFTIGAYMAKYKERYLKESWIGVPCLGGISGLGIWLLLIALVVFRCCFATGAFHTLYVAAFILLFVKAPRPKALDNFLMEMGRRSTSMWFVHTYFCIYLFHDWIYSFRYPILIFCILLACSYICAVVIDQINANVKKII